MNGYKQAIRFETFNCELSICSLIAFQKFLVTEYIMQLVNANINSCKLNLFRFLSKLFAIQFLHKLSLIFFLAIITFVVLCILKNILHLLTLTVSGLGQQFKALKFATFDKVDLICRVFALPIEDLASGTIDLLHAVTQSSKRLVREHFEYFKLFKEVCFIV